MATAPTGLCQADNDVLQVGSRGGGRGVGVLPAVTFTGLFSLPEE